MHTAGTDIGTDTLTFLKMEPVIGYMPLSLFDLRDITTNDIGAVLGAGTTPILERVDDVTDKAIRVHWVLDDVDEIQFPSVYMPPDLDSDKDITIHLVADMSGATDSPVINIEVFDGIGDTEMGGDTGTITNTLAEVTRTIVAADLTGHPLGFLSISLIPAAHGTDAIRLYSAWIEYTRKVA